MFFAKGRTGTIIFKEIWTESVKPERNWEDMQNNCVLNGSYHKK